LDDQVSEIKIETENKGRLIALHCCPNFY